MVMMATAMAAMGLVVDQVDLPDTQDTVIQEFQSLLVHVQTCGDKMGSRVIVPPPGQNHAGTL